VYSDGGVQLVLYATAMTWPLWWGAAYRMGEFLGECQFVEVDFVVFDRQGEQVGGESLENV